MSKRNRNSSRIPRTLQRIRIFFLSGIASHRSLRLSSYRVEIRVRQGFSRGYTVLVVVAEHAVEQIEPIWAARLAAPCASCTASSDDTPRLLAMRSQHLQQSGLQDNV